MRSRYRKSARTWRAPEVYLAIQQGAVAGQENPIDTIFANKFYEVAKNVTLTQHAFGRDIAWTTELRELLMVWVTFLGSAAATRRGAHMAITEFLDKLGDSRRRAADAAIQCLVIGVLGLLVIYGWKVTEAGWNNELTVLGWPMSTQNIALPIASLLTMLFAAWDLVLIVQGKTRPERYGTGH